MSVFSRILDFFDGDTQNHAAVNNGFPPPLPSPRVGESLVVNDGGGKQQSSRATRPPIVFTNGQVLGGV